jgi:hypothetical protein
MSQDLQKLCEGRARVEAIRATLESGYVMSKYVQKALDEGRALLHRMGRHIELSPGAGAECQQYGIATCDDIEMDLRDLFGRSLSTDSAPPQNTAQPKWRCQACGGPLAHDPIGTAAICEACVGSAVPREQNAPASEER